MTAFINSILVALFTTIFSLLFGLPLAVLIARTNLPFKKYIKYLYITPIFIPPTLIAITWISLAGSAGWLYSIPGSVCILTLCYFPFVTLLSISGLSVVNRDLEDAAGLEFTKLGVLRHVTIPYAANYILSGAIFVFVCALSNYEVPALLGVRTFPVEIFAQFSAFYNTKLAVLYSLPLVAAATALVLVMGSLMSGKDYVAVGRHWREPRVMPLGKRTKTTALLFAGALLVTSVILPLATLLKKAGGLKVYGKALNLSLNELIFSFTWAFIGATVITLVSFIISYLLARKEGRWRNLLYYLSILPFAIPATVCGIALIKLFNKPYLNILYSTPLILLIGYMIRFSPFTIRILESAIRHVDRSFEEEATLEGAGLFRRLFMILAPISRHALATSWIVAFAFIMGEIGLTVLVIPPGHSTLILKLYTLMHYGSGSLVAGLAVISVVVILIPIAIVARRPRL